MVTSKEFLFIDESGNPGSAGNPIYIVVGLHLTETCVHRVRQHMTSFRYHHDVVKELKEQRNPDKLTPQTRRLMVPLAEMCDAGEISATANWCDKAVYKTNRGPYLGEGQKFRNFQVRLLLQRHHSLHPWFTDLDVVLDRWSMDEAQRRNLEEYLKGNFKLRPTIQHVTTVDSDYVDPIQIVDVYARLLRRVVENKAPTPDEVALVPRLMEVNQITRGLY
jgi:hypothetical protein